MMKKDRTKAATTKKTASKKTPLKIKAVELLDIERLAEDSRKRAAKALGISLDAFKKIKDADKQLYAARLAMAHDLGLQEVPELPNEEEYEGLVSYYLSMLLVLAAKSPFNFRSEIDRQIRVLTRIKKRIPKRKRTPGEDVKLALEMLNQGSTLWQAYPDVIKAEQYGKDYKDMNPREKALAKRTLREKVRALKKIRETRALKASKSANTSKK
jgi:hypothetical protein